MSLNIEQLIPQKAPMLFIDELLSIDEQKAVARFTITKDMLFYDSEINGVHAFVGVELMAQTTAAYASYQQQTGKPRMGFLLSVRKFISDVEIFHTGDTLTITAEKVLIDDNMGVFNCAISREGVNIATARLSAYQPDEQMTERLLNPGAHS